MEQKPNILFIMTDQQAAHMMSCAGNDFLHTPAMDSLADQGIRFEKTYCTNPICAPSRISMVTGMMPCRLGAEDNEMSGKIDGLSDEIVENSMGNLMKKAGYETFYGGKVHLCNSIKPHETNYDEIFRNEREELPQACIDFIKKKRNNPFFAVASFINPHDICFAHRAKNNINNHDVLELRKKALGLPLDELPPLPVNYTVPQNEPAAVKTYLDPKAITPAIIMRDEYDEYEWRINRWIYHRLTEQVDSLIGEILEGLKEAGHEKDTLVIFTSDHGNMDASHRLASKGIFYEESVGIPFIMKYPGAINCGQKDDINLVSSGLDILPTLCDYAGIDKPCHFLGKSLRPLAENTDHGEWRNYIAAENEWFRMIRSRDYKYCEFAGNNSIEWLGNIADDPEERQNLAENPDYADVLNKHQAMLAEWSKISNDQDIAKFLA